MNRLLSSIASRTRGSVGRSAARRTTPSPVAPGHDLVLYEYEASPWCRLVREHMTILDLKVNIRPCPRQTLFLEGAYNHKSRFRPEAMEYLKSSHHTDDMTFPILVDRTKSKDSPKVIIESYSILEHLWEEYGQTVEEGQDRPDQWWNAPSIPFPIRFMSLAGPSYLRPFPSCGVLQTPSIWNSNENEITLYQAEGCPESRLIRETLCTLEIPYLSVAAGINSANSAELGNRSIPILKDGDNTFYGADQCNDYLWKKYKDPSGKVPTYWNMLSTEENLGRAGPWGVGAYTAFLKGSRAFVPERAMK